jgi:hypothetical protein
VCTPKVTGFIDLLQVDGTLYCLHQYLFSRDSVHFSTRFVQLGVRDHEALSVTISLGNIKCKDFDAFLSIIYPEYVYGPLFITVLIETYISTHRDFEQYNLSYEEWISVLHLSTHWDFASIRRLALNNIQPPTPHDWLLLAREYSVDDWVIPALSVLCERSTPLSLEEARQMNIEDIILVATVREDIRNPTLRVDAGEIPRRVEAAQAGKLVSGDGGGVPPAVPTSGAIEQASSPAGKKRAPTDYEAGGGGGQVLVSPVAVRTRR